MERGTAPFSVDRRGYHVHWDGTEETLYCFGDPGP
jgi:hypothetical protein